MTMIDNYKAIYEQTNLCLGQIVNDGVETYKGKTKNEIGCIYDEKSYNFHLIPADKKIFDDFSDKTYNKWCSLTDIIRRRNEWKDKLLNKRCGGGINNLSQRTGGKYDKNGNLFTYIRIIYKGIAFDLNFNRFYISEGKVNCRLYSPQFSCQKLNPGYPSSEDAGKYAYGSMYYNPKNSFDNDEELIKEFFDFILYKSNEFLK